MNRQAHANGISIRPPTSRSRRGKHLLAGITLLATLALTLALPSPAFACARPLDSIDIWVIVDGDMFWIIIRNYQTFATQPEGFSCTCALPRLPSIQSIDSGLVLDDAGREPVTAFGEFMPDQNASDLYQTTFPAAGPFFGLRAPVSAPIPANLRVVIELHGRLVPEATLDDLLGDLRDGFVATGEANEEATAFTSTPILLPPDIVDPAPGAPLIRAVQMSMGPPQSVTLTVRDAEEGLRTIEMADADHTEGTFAPFASGVKGPVAVTVAMTGDSPQASFAVRACNMRGQCSTDAALLLGMAVERTIASHTLAGVKRSQNKLRFLNDEHGIRRLTVKVNGRRFSIGPLAPGQSLEVDLSLAFQPGDNEVTVAVRGAPGSAALLMLSER